MNNEQRQQKVFEHRSRFFEYRTESTTQKILKRKVGLLYKHTKKFIKGKVLDIGAGPGLMVKFLREKGINIKGIDIIPNELVFKGVITDLGKDLYDTIICSHILEHLTEEEITKGLEEVRRILKGHLILAVPYKEDLNKLICPFCKEHVIGHQISLDEELIKDFLEKAKFRIIKIIIYPATIMFRLPFIPAELFMLFDKWIDLNKDMIVIAS